jgi:hypothetical protein
MAVDGRSNKNLVPVRVKTVDLASKTLVDRIGEILLGHLSECQTCFSVFAAQIVSLEQAGCVEGKRILSQSQLDWEEHRSKLALQHLTRDVLEDYVFNRLTTGEKEALESHASWCADCRREIKDRRALVECMKLAFARLDSAESKTGTATAINVRFPERAISTCIGKD